MNYIADLHIHSHYSIATSKLLTPRYLDYWARRKGITVLGTGDCIHPGWLSELREQLEPAEPGFYRLKDDFRLKEPSDTGTAGLFSGKPVQTPETPRFVLTGEISNIYKKNDKVRKVHNLILAPDFETVETIQSKLAARGNITSDGRPILGLDSRDLLEIVLSSRRGGGGCTSEDTYFQNGPVLIPAHIWTPWFSALGSKSGFDTIEECYGDLTDHIFAIETGLSSDPPMNWMCSFLDPYTIISNSDAHSPEKIGREATLFDTELSYDAMINAMKNGDARQCRGTIEFFPQEGKYHFDGHRKCGIRWDPAETIKQNGVCPKCGKKVTIGVLNRVARLADRKEWNERPIAHPFYSLIPLKELLAEFLMVGSNTRKVNRAYEALITKAGSELALLHHLAIDDVKTIAGEAITEGIRRMRNREIVIEEGYDGEYGKMSVFSEKKVGKTPMISMELSLLSHNGSTPEEESTVAGATPPAGGPNLEDAAPPTEEITVDDAVQPLGFSSFHTSQQTLFTQEMGIASLLSELNKQQKQAVEHHRGPALILAGPGTGKTRTLTYRIARLIEKHNVSPDSIAALTFTNRAAEEIANRLRTLLPRTGRGKAVFTGTFHRFGLSVLKKHIDKTGRSKNFIIIGRPKKENLISLAVEAVHNDLLNTEKGKNNREFSTKTAEKLITSFKQQLFTPRDIEDSAERLLYERYQSLLLQYDCFDFDDCLYWPVIIFTQYPDTVLWYRNSIKWLLVDEYQDVNFAQYRLVRELMPLPDSSLFVIGDPDQAIYGFRGADVTYINRFLSDYPEATLYSLKQSYRCSDTILKAADQVIHHGPRERNPSVKNSAPGSHHLTPPPLLRGIGEGVKITVTENRSEKSEAECIARTIERMIGGVRFFSMDSRVTGGYDDNDFGFSDFAVLCRISRQMEVLEKALNDHAVPYRKIDTAGLFQEEPAATIIDLMKLALSPENRLLARKLIKKRGIAQSDISEFIEQYHIGNTTAKALAYKAGMVIAKSEDDASFNMLLTYAEKYGIGIEQFLHNATLGTNMDLYAPNSEQVSLMTLHAAKGLEFPCVFITGCEEGIIPYSLFSSSTSDYEEERRLLYVGMTRAKQYLSLTYAGKRFLFGREHRLPKSPFISQIEKELTEMYRPDHTMKKQEHERQLTLF